MTTTTNRKKYVVSFIVRGQGRKFQVLTETGVSKLLRGLRKTGSYDDTVSVQDAPQNARVGRVWWSY